MILTFWGKYDMLVTVADPGGPGGPPPPMLKLVKKDGCCTTLQVL